MDDRTYRLNRLNALATLMDLLGFSVAEARRMALETILPSL